MSTTTCPDSAVDHRSSSGKFLTSLPAGSVKGIREERNDVDTDGRSLTTNQGTQEEEGNE